MYMWLIECVAGSLYTYKIYVFKNVDHKFFFTIYTCFLACQDKCLDSYWDTPSVVNDSIWGQQGYVYEVIYFLETINLAWFKLVLVMGLNYMYIFQTWPVEFGDFLATDQWLISIWSSNLHSLSLFIWMHKPFMIQMLYVTYICSHELPGYSFWTGSFLSISIWFSLQLHQSPCCFHKK